MDEKNLVLEAKDGSSFRVSCGEVWVEIYWDKELSRGLAMQKAITMLEKVISTEVGQALSS